MGLMKSFGSYLIMLLNREDQGDVGDVLTRVGDGGIEFQAPSGGNPFDQSLNTDDSPTFAGVTVPLIAPTIEATAETGGSLAADTYYLAAVVSARNGFSPLSDEHGVVVEADGKIAVSVVSDDVIGVQQLRIFVGTAPGVYLRSFDVDKGSLTFITDLSDGEPDPVVPAATGSIGVILPLDGDSFLALNRVYAALIRSGVGSNLVLQAGGNSDKGASLDLDTLQNNLDGTFSSNGFHLLGGISFGLNANANLNSRIQAGTSTGTGTPGTIEFYLASPGASGTDVNEPTLRGDMNEGVFTWDGAMKLTPRAFAALPATPTEGMMAWVNDSNTATWGATIAGGGANKVLAVFNGTNWTVAGV